MSGIFCYCCHYNFMVFHDSTVVSFNKDCMVSMCNILNENIGRGEGFRSHFQIAEDWLLPLFV